MKTSYIRQMRHNYMVIEGAEQCRASYEVTMIQENRLSPFLNLQLRQENRQVQFFYEITSKQPLERLLEYEELDGEKLAKLVREIDRLLKTAEEYLLDEGSILLDPEHIYVDSESFRLWFCYLPGYEGDFSAKLEQLFHYLLGKVNHQDKEAVILAYGLYQESQKENYGIEGLLKLVKESGAPDLKNGLSADPNAGRLPAAEWEKEWRGGQKEGRKEEWEEPAGSAAAFFSEQSQRAGMEQNSGEWQAQIHKKQHRKAQTKALLLWAGGSFLLPLLLWLIMGEHWLREYKWLVLMAEVMGTVITFGRLIRPSARGRLNKPETYPGEVYPSGAYPPEVYPSGVYPSGAYPPEVYSAEAYPGEADPAAVYRPDQSYSFDKDNRLYPEKEQQAVNAVDTRTTMNAVRAVKEVNTVNAVNAANSGGSDGVSGYGNTVLLADYTEDFQSGGQPAKYMLKSEKAADKSIPLPYFPFLIGKQEGIVDYVLQDEVVSRLHLKIQEKDGEFYVTDLNSANGTKVDGYCLAANETVLLAPGAALSIAGKDYFFVAAED